MIRDRTIRLVGDVYAYGSKTVLIRRTFLLMGCGGLWGWGGVGALTFCLVRTVHISTLPRSLECLTRYMLLQRVAKVVPRLVGIVENSFGALDFEKSCLFVKRIGNA